MSIILVKIVGGIHPKHQKIWLELKNLDFKLGAGGGVQNSEGGDEGKIGQNTKFSENIKNFDQNWKIKIFCPGGSKIVKRGGGGGHEGNIGQNTKLWGNRPKHQGI